MVVTRDLPTCACVMSQPYAQNHLLLPNDHTHSHGYLREHACRSSAEDARTHGESEAGGMLATTRH